MNRINHTCLAAVIENGCGNVDDNNDLFFYGGAVHDRHDRFPPVSVLDADIETAARAAVELYNAVRAGAPLARAA